MATPPPRYDIQKEWELECQAIISKSISKSSRNDMTQNEWEFYYNDATESIQILTVNNDSLYHGRARAVQGGVVIFLPGVKIEDIK